MSWYRGRKVFISGGSKGIGRALAVKMARLGASVVVSARGQAALDEAVAELRQVGGPGQVFGSVAFDVKDGAAVRAGAAEALRLLGGMDLVVCNSGHALTGKVLDVPEDTFQEMLTSNYLGHVAVVRALAPTLVAQGKGDVCLVSSMLGFMGMYGYGAYAASKFAIAGFAQALRQELLLHGVRVTLFYPPTTKTPGLEKENETKPPDVWALESDSGWNKTYTAEEVADRMLVTIERGTFEGLVGSDSWLIYSLARHLPGITRSFADGDLKKAIAKVAAKG